MSGPLPPVAKVIRADFFQTLGANANVRDRLFFQYSGALSSTDLTTLLNTFSAAWNTNISPLQEASASLNSIEGTDLSTASSPQIIVTASHAGTGGGAQLPNNSAVVIRFKIARRYRGGHPRFYLGGLAAAIVTNGDQILSASQTAITNAWIAFIAACEAAPPAAVGTLSHVNVHYFSGFTVVTNPITHRARNVPTPLVTPTPDTVISYSTNPKLASQRRRNQQSS